MLAFTRENLQKVTLVRYDSKGRWLSLHTPPEHNPGFRINATPADCQLGFPNGDIPIQGAEEAARIVSLLVQSTGYGFRRITENAVSELAVYVREDRLSDFDIGWIKRKA